MKIELVRTIGKPTNLEKIKYIPRPGSFLLLVNTEGQLGLVKTPKGYYLPGGGWEPGENARKALKRELLEEIGFLFLGSKFKYWGRNNAYFSDLVAHRYYLMLNFYFSAEIQDLRKVGEPLEKDHRLVWKDPDEIGCLTVPSAQKDMILQFMPLRR